MNISLNQDSDVPLRQELSEQIVFLITTGELRAGEEMPSVRALARRANVHHNTQQGVPGACAPRVAYAKAREPLSCRVTSK
jgi:DNA-binding transcriptional MocR family regulator